MRTPSYVEKLQRVTEQHDRLEKTKGKPGPRFNQYMKQRKAAVKEQSDASK